MRCRSVLTEEKAWPVPDECFVVVDSA